jgi:ABC-2 type transport system ATP-binding protein
MIQVENLSKVYGSRVAVWKVDFTVEKGEILGFLGPNGAGKTTTMRMITGFIPPSEGTAKVDGHDITRDPLAAKARIGYLCEAPPLYREMSVSGYLAFVAGIRGVPGPRRKGAVDRVIELCGLQDVRSRILGHLSKGYRQRAGLAQAIVHEPSVLILDEPTSGLDPRQIIEIRQLIRGLGGEQTVILSTHILPEVTVTCDRVVIINEGQIVAEDTIDRLTEGLDTMKTFRLEVARDTADLAGRLSALEGVGRVLREEEGVYELRVRAEEQVRERLASEVVASGAGLLELSRKTASLEEVFLQLVTEEEEEGDAV